MSVPGEFSLIARHFRALAGDGALELTDDAAVFAPPPGREIAVAADAMVEGVHFLPDDPPDTVGRKLLRVNLSDMAAMGAVPFAYLMTLSLPRAEEAWLAGFCAGLASDQRQYGVRLLGGDTTSTHGPAVLSLTVLGSVAPGAAVVRGGARPGDALWVTGTIGDGALGLAVRTGRLSLPEPHAGFLVDRYRLPQPRLLPIAGFARAAMDVSDGLVQDLGHICRASGCGAEVEAASVPASDAARAAGEDWLVARLTGGDDYELLLALPPDVTPPFAATRIGRFVAGVPEVVVRDAAGAPILLSQGGWSHFA